VNRSIFEVFKKSDIERMQNTPQYIPDVEMVYSLRVIPERNVTLFPIISHVHMFNWDEIPGNDSGILLDYLEQEYGIDGVKTAKIEKIDNGNTIIVSVDELNLSLSLNNEKTVVSIRIDDGLDYEFIASSENGKLNIFKSISDKAHLLVIDDAGEELINTNRIDGMAVMSNQTYTFKSESKLDFPGMNISNASVVYISFFAFEMSSGRYNENNQFVILDDELNVIVVRYTKFQAVT
jgi:hypothetical protein